MFKLAGLEANPNGSDYPSSMLIDMLGTRSLSGPCPNRFGSRLQMCKHMDDLEDGKGAGATPFGERDRLRILRLPPRFQCLERV